MSVTIYHNPRCSKSRQTLQIIEEKGITPEIVEYLKTALDADQIKNILSMLGKNPREIMRTGEAVYKELGLKDVNDDEALIAAMAENPILIERPIVVVGDQARMGRPPENVIEIL